MHQEEILADGIQVVHVHSVLQKAIVSYRHFRIIPPIHVLTESCPAPGETGCNDAGIFDQARTEEVDTVL